MNTKGNNNIPIISKERNQIKGLITANQYLG